MKKKSDGYFQVSLMNVFRQAARDRDAKQGSVEVTDDGGRVLSKRTVQRREGAGEDLLRKHLMDDLVNLLGTINMESVQALDEFPHVQKSILNYGIMELSRTSTDSIHSPALLRDLKTALLRHEPRLIDETVQVKLRHEETDTGQRVSLSVNAEMTAKPVDVPLEFVAEIDAGAGKLALSSLTVRG
jgi:type VI secretion system protein ImpF